MFRQLAKLNRSLLKGWQEIHVSVTAELRALRSPDQPASELAAAFALGTLISFIPVPFLDSLLVGLVFTRCKRINRAPIFLARVIWNDFLVYPLFGFGFRLAASLVDPMASGSALTALESLLTAALILAISASSAGYLLFYVGLKLLRSVGPANSPADRGQGTVSSLPPAVLSPVECPPK